MNFYLQFFIYFVYVSQQTCAIPHGVFLALLGYMDLGEQSLNMKWTKVSCKSQLHSELRVTWAKCTITSTKATHGKHMFFHMDIWITTAGVNLLLSGGDKHIPTIIPSYWRNCSQKTLALFSWVFSQALRILGLCSDNGETQDNL